MTDEPSTKTEFVLAALDRYERPLIRYAARITGDIELARDVVQDTFLRLCEADRARVDGHLAAWLYTVCRNRALDVRRKEGRMGSLQEGQAESIRSNAPGPGTVAQTHEEYGLVLDALGALPENQQEAFRLKFQGEMTYREIGEVMGISLGTVSHLVGAALDSLREQLRGKINLAQEV